MSEILPHCMFKNGSQFTVSDTVRQKRVPPNSICYMVGQKAYITRVPNVSLFEAFVMRRGKKGKLRTEKEILASPIFPIELEKRPLRKENIDSFPLVEMSSVPHSNSNLLLMDELEFIGWAVSRYSALVKPLRHTKEGENIYRKLRKNKNLDRMFELSEISIRMESHPEETLEEFKSDVNRVEIIEGIRRIEGHLPQAGALTCARDGVALLMALSYLMWSNRIKKGKFYEEKSLMDSYEFYRREISAILDEVHRLKLQKYETLPKNLRDTVKVPKIRSVPLKAKDVISTVKDYIESEVTPSFHKIIMRGGTAEGWLFRTNYTGNGGMVFPEGE